MVAFKRLLLYMSLLFVLLTIVKFANADLNSTLTHYYSFDTNYNDEKGSENMVNDGSTSVSGILGSAAYCDGTNDKITISDPWTNAGLSSFTKVMWINVTTANDGYAVRERGALVYDRLWFDSGNVYWSVHDGAWKEVSVANTNVSDWQMFTMVWNNTHVTLFVNNLRIGAAAVGSETTDSNGVNFCHDGGSAYWNGDIDEVGLWQNIQFNQTHVNALWNDGAGCNPLTTECEGPAPCSLTEVNEVLVQDGWDSGAATGTVEYGVAITVEDSINITSIGMASAQTCTACGIYNASNHVLLTSGTITDDVCTITENNTLYTGQSYYIINNPFAASCDNGVNDAQTFPLDIGVITVTDGVYDNDGHPFYTGNNYIWDIHNITYVNATSTECQDTPAAGTPSLTLTSNLVAGTNNTENPYEANFTGTIGDNSDIYNCTTYLNNTLNTTFTDINISNVHWWNLTYGAQEVGYDLNISCENQNSTDNLFIDNFFIDSVIPLQQTTNYTNGTYFYYNYSDTTFLVNTTVSDSFLFATNFSFIYPNGTVIHNQENQSLTGTSFNHYWNISLNNATKYPNGTYTWRIQGWDAHTANEINPSDYEFYYGLDGEVLVNDELMIFGDELKTTLAYFASDRYKLRITFDNQALSHTFQIHNTEDLYYIDNDYHYKGWFVWWGKYKRWIDFEGNNIKSVDVTELGNNHYEITVHHYTITDEVELESIGDLNAIQEDLDVNLAYPLLIRAYDLELFEANVSSQLSDFTVYLYYENGSQYLNVSTTDNVAEVPVWNGTWNTSVVATSYITNYTDINYSMLNNFSFYLNSSLTTYITFYDSSGNGNPMTGVIRDYNGSWNFTNQLKIGISSLDVEEGEVGVLFNGVSGVNWTQYYEYENDGTVGGNIDLYTIDDADMYAYFRVLDQSGYILDNAIVKAEYSYPGSDSDNKDEFKLMGQRLSEADGYAFLWFDSRSQVRITVQKEGYNNYSDVWPIADTEATSKASAIEIYLTPYTSYQNSYAYVMMPNEFYENTSGIQGNIYAPDTDAVVQYKTDTNPVLQTATTTRVEDFYYFKLINGTDFLTGKNETFYFYLDGNEVVNFRIIYRPAQEGYTDLADLINMDPLIGYKLMFIGLIIISAIMASLLNIRGAGAATFRGGTILLALMYEPFTTLGIINVLYVVFRMVYRQVSE